MGGVLECSQHLQAEEQRRGRGESAREHLPLPEQLPLRVPGSGCLLHVSEGGEEGG